MPSDLLSESGISLDRLRAFCLVVESGGFTRAAGGDATKQPLLSRQVKELETFFGAELLLRSGRRVTLTEHGRTLYQIAANAFGALSDFKATCQGQPMEIRVGAGDSVIQWLILPTLKELRTRCPDLHLQLLNLTTQVVVERLQSGEVEFGIVRSDAISERLTSLPLGAMKFAFFAPKRLAEPKGRTPTWQEIWEACPMASLDGHGSYRQTLNAASTKAGVKPRVDVECSSFPMMAKAMATAQLGGVLPVAAATELPKGDHVVVKAPWTSQLNRKMSLAWNPSVAKVRTRVEEIGRTLADLWSV